MDLAAAGRYYALQKSFKNAIKCLHGACSREVVKNAFPSFTDEERERMYRMLTSVMRSMHDGIAEDFDELCQQVQVAVVLDKIDQFIEEHNLDQLSSSDKTSVDATEEKILRMKKDAIEDLVNSLKKVEENNNGMKARIELWKKEEDSTTARDLLNEMIQRDSACLENTDI